MSFVVGVTGGIGSGKSAVARAFEALGVEAVDADTVAHAISRRGEPGYRAVVDAFGPDCVGPDGELDRGWLRQRAFADPAFRKRLEGLLHPLIRARLDAVVAAWRGPYGLLVVPLLLERGGNRDRCDRVLVVDCPEEEQVRRVGTRSGLSPADVRAIMATQLPRAERLARADDVIDNAGAPDALPPQVAALDIRYRQMAAERGAGPEFRAQ